MYERENVDHYEVTLRLLETTRCPSCAETELKSKSVGSARCNHCREHVNLTLIPLPSGFFLRVTTTKTSKYDYNF